jgi:hypothetical protein
MRPYAERPLRALLQLVADILVVLWVVVVVRDVDTDLLALRAITRRPARRLLAVSPDPAAAWRRDDREIVHRLAALELAALGLRSPKGPTGLNAPPPTALDRCRMHLLAVPVAATCIRRRSRLRR